MPIRVVVAGLVCCMTALVGCDRSSPRILEPGQSSPNPVPPTTPVPATGLEGTYTVTFSAGENCSDIPPEFQQRTYRATVHSVAPNIDALALAGADFYQGYDSFFAPAQPSGLGSIYVSSWYAFNAWLEDHPIFERLPTGGYVAVIGRSSVSMPIPPGSISVALDGSYSYCGVAVAPERPFWPPSCSAPVVCRSSHHKLTITPLAN